MNAQQIIAELPRLKPEELQRVKIELDALVGLIAGGRNPGSPGAPTESSAAKESLAAFLLRSAGTVDIES
jgi:hypothetical protein